LFKCIRNHLLLKSKLAVCSDWTSSKSCLCAALHLGSNPIGSCRNCAVQEQQGFASTAKSCTLLLLLAP
jgi:hypothetical protein